MGSMRVGRRQGGVRLAARIAALAGAGLAAACAGRFAGGGASPGLERYEGREITRVTIVGAQPFPADTLARLIETGPTHCSLLGLPICLGRLGREERRLDVEQLYEDARRLELFFQRSGFFDTRVAPGVIPASGDGVAVEFAVALGPEIRLATLAVTGIEVLPDADRVLRRLPIRPGDRFHLGEFASAADTILRALRAEGHAYAVVLRSYDVELATGTAHAALDAVPGPVVVVDSIIVRGATALGRRATLRQLAIRQGDVLRLDRLVESERNLYALELVQFASVGIAPDSLQLTPRDSSTATVLVSVAEGPVHVVDASAGFGSVECFRARTRWVSRSFGGGARRLELLAHVSKIGIGRPLDFGLGGICAAYRDDPFRDELDYRLSAELTQPWFLSPRNHLTASAWSEQVSEPNVFQRRSSGARVLVSRRLAPRNVLTASAHAEYGRTIASDAIYCLAFIVCDPSSVEDLADARWLNTVSVGWVRDRSNNPVDPSDGHVERLSLTVAPEWLGSDAEFVRGTGELAVYSPLGGDRVGAFRIRVGTFFGTAEVDRTGRDFLPPQERFYAGGATSVRGFETNAMGPGVYVASEGIADPATGTVLVEADRIRFFPTGGTSLVTMSGELRTPSPFLARLLRLAFFVDAGVLAAGRLRDVTSDDWAVTPGIGARFTTPVGPIRVDIAYNPFPPPRGPLYVPSAEGDTLVRVADDFRLERPGWLRRFQLHLGVGQAF